MPAIRYTHNPGRTPVRLLSTPKGTFMSATVAGVKFSDQLAALLDHAEASGFRIECDTRKGRPPGVLVYAPDKDVPPFSVQEEKAKFNPSHYDNIRRQLYRSGCPPLPGDRTGSDDETAAAEPAPNPFLRSNTPGVILANSREEALAQAPEGASVVEMGPFGLVDDTGADLTKILRDEDTGPAFIAQVVLGLMEKSGAGDAEAGLVAMLTKTAASWVATFSVGAMNDAVEQASIEIRRGFEKEINEALAMASEHEATAARLTKALERAEAAEKKARDDCGAAIARAKVAEAKAAELEAAIRPLRTLLGNAS